jgi:predicted metalloprotease with PDZ domain
VIGHYLSADSRRLLKRAVVDHGDLAAPDQAPAMGGCAHPFHQELPTFDLGLDLARSLSTNQINGVVENGPAFVAGLRDGQPITDVSVKKGDPDRLARFTIHTDAGDRQITFYPRGKIVAAWQYRLDQLGPCGRVP